MRALFPILSLPREEGRARRQAPTPLNELIIVQRGGASGRMKHTKQANIG